MVFQESLFDSIIKKKINNRKLGVHTDTAHYLIFCEHPHVYTIGKSGDENNLLIPQDELERIEATYFQTNRGGDITYHGPGQIVMYPIFDLDFFFSDIHKYLRYLEEAVIQTLAHYGISAGRYEGFTGVWIDPDGANPRKICAIGVRTSRWVTMHGIGFNINTDLSYFNYMNPCGIEIKSVTSMQKELGKALDIKEVKEILMQKMSDIFEFDFL